MRITKRQLKRIIKEEYTRLMESYHGDEMYVEQIMEELASGDEMSYAELARALSGIIPGFDEGELGSAIDTAMRRRMIQARFGRDGLGIFSISPQYRM